jgi:hypothetical protein
MLHLRKDRSQERGQILVLFELVLIIILACAALVIDLGMLRNNRQILVNTFDAAAISGGSQLPVTGPTAQTKLEALVDNTIQKDYPGLIKGSNYHIVYKCLIGANATGPLIARDIPVTCDPRLSFGVPINNPPNASDIATLTPKFIGAGLTRVSDCHPELGDKCNVVQISGSATTQYALAPVVGINSGSTGTVVSAACNGPCGASTSIPVDLVVIIDRTASMVTPTNKVQATRDAANAVLTVYNPAIQRVAFGLLGPSSAYSTCNGSGGPAVKANYQQNTTLTAPNIAGSTTANVQSAANASAGATTLVISKPTSTVSGDFLIAGITVAGGTGTTVSPPAGWTLIQRTDNATNVSLLTYYHVAGGSEGANYTWTITTPVAGARMSGGILRYTGVNTASPINVSSANTGSGTAVTANSVTTTSAQTAVVGFYGTATNTSFTPPGGTPTATERFDRANAAGPTLEGVTLTEATAGATGNKAATAAATGQWAAQLIALNPTPVDTYGTDPTNTADRNSWIPVGFTGTDTDTPAPVYNEAYVSGSPATLNASSHIVSAIACFDAGYMGTQLATPTSMAAYYLQHFGRPNVTWGILLETDGYPQYVSGSDTSNYTCLAASNAATAAKGIKNANGMPIQIFTVGFGLDGSNDHTCPDSGTWSGKTATQLLASMATQPSVDGGCPGTSNTDGDHFFCQPKTSDLTTIFSQIATTLAGKGSHLVQLYPAPVVTHAAGPTSSVAISGQYFSGATSVTIGGTSVSFVVGSDSSITAQAPAAPSGTVVDVIVSSPGGTSSISPADHYTYP